MVVLPPTEERHLEAPSFCPSLFFAWLRRCPRCGAARQPVPQTAAELGAGKMHVRCQNGHSGYLDVEPVLTPEQEAIDEILRVEIDERRAGLCGVCRRPLARGGTGDPRKYHRGACAAEANRRRQAVRNEQVRQSTRDKLV